MQLGAAVEEDVLFRLCDTIVDRDVAGALVTLEELAERGLDLAQLTRDLLEHLRHLLLVQHLGHVPDSLPLTEEARDRLREQANQLPEPTVVRLIDLLAVVLEDDRQGGDPRLPLELALVKVTRPQSDLARESLVHRVELLESRVQAGPPAAESWGPSPVPAPAAGPAPSRAESPAERRPPRRTSRSSRCRRRGAGACSPRSRSARSRSRPCSPRRAPSGLEGDTLTLSFRPGAEFHRTQAEEPNNAQLLRDALYDVTGRRLAVVTSIADSVPDDGADEGPLDERGFIALLESDLDATEVEDAS